MSGRGRGRPPKSADDEPSAKKAKEGTVVVKEATMGRPKKTLAEKNPDANLLLKVVIGTIGGIKAGSNDGDFISDEKFIVGIKKAIEKNDKATAVYLHQYVTDKCNEREIIIQEKRTVLHKEKKRARFTAAQKQFAGGFESMTKDESEKMKQFLIVCLKDLDYLTLTSEKITPQLEVERLFRLTMDSMDDRKTSSLRGIPQGDTQDAGAYGDDFSSSDDDDDEPAAGKKRAGSDDDTVVEGY